MEFLKSNWYYIVPIMVALVSIIGLWKQILRVFAGMVLVPEDKIGLITKKFVLLGKKEESSGIIATDGQGGYQANYLDKGSLKWKYWPWQYSIDMTPFVVIPEGHIGIVNAKDGKALETGRILARRVECDNYQDAAKFLANGGQKGRQSAYIAAGSWKINTHLFEVSTVKQVTVQENMVGIITTLDGEPLKEGQIAGETIEGHGSFQNFDAFLNNGGKRGLQQQIVQAGTYFFNPWAIMLEEVKMTEIPIGWVGVVISYIGEDGKDVTGTSFKHGNLVEKGKKGVWVEPLNPGKYAINPYTIRVEVVPTTNLVLNWASARTESHNLDKNLSTITVRSKDGFPFNLDVSQIIHIPMTEAPKVIARFGNMMNLVSQVLEPTIGNYFRNSAQDSDVIAFLSTRKERQDAAKARISEVLEEYNVHAVDTLIGDITPPESLMKTLTDRKIAQEQEMTFDGQRKAQVQRQLLAKETSIADMQGEVVRAEQGVAIAARDGEALVKKNTSIAQSVEIAAKAEGNAIITRADATAYKTAKEGKATGESILEIGRSTAQAYKEQVMAMGQDNFTSFKITESIGQNHIKLMPDVLITGGSNGNSTDGPMSGLLAMKIMGEMDKYKADKNVVDVTPTTVPPVNTDSNKK